MAFTRRSLSALGLNEEQVEKVMTLHGTSMSDFIPKSELQSRIDTAIADAQKNAPAPNIKESDDYKTLQREYEDYKHKIEISAELKRGGVKEKFIDNVFSLLEDGKPTAEQLAAIREKYEEYFDTSEHQSVQTTPQFGAKVEGSMPTGKTSPNFGDYWSFGKSKGD